MSITFEVNCISFKTENGRFGFSIDSEMDTRGNKNVNIWNDAGEDVTLTDKEAVILCTELLKEINQNAEAAS